MQRRVKTRHLEAVIALAEELHYGRAAERVGLTQSGLSRCIQSAEREANAKLFIRDRRTVEITDAGRSYVEHARISLAHGERAMRSAKEPTKVVIPQPGLPTSAVWRFRRSWLSTRPATFSRDEK